MHGAKIVTPERRKLGPIGEGRQAQLVVITRLKFQEHATTEQWEAFARDRARWIDSRGGEPPTVIW